jgi:hypothetical protein
MTRSLLRQKNHGAAARCSAGKKKRLEVRAKLVDLTRPGEGPSGLDILWFLLHYITLQLRAPKWTVDGTIRTAVVTAARCAHVGIAVGTATRNGPRAPRPGKAA